jgi:mannose-1-phosphate guanylyltransferase
VERALAVTDRKEGRIVIITGKEHVHLALEACAAFTPDEKKRMVLIPEPEAKNTAAAVACGLIYADRISGAARNMLVLTSDHIIKPLRTFKADALAAAAFALRDKLVVFGIPPVRPETGYGYIEGGRILSGRGKVREAASFREKPDPGTAEKFAASKKFYWNSGMFAFSSKFMIGCFRKYAPDVIRPFEKLPVPGKGSYRVRKGLRVLEKWTDLDAAYKKTKNISFDYAVAEKCSRTVMVKAGFNWTDAGNWDEYAKIAGNTGAEVYGAAASSCFVDSDIPVALAGVRDLIVAVRRDKKTGASLVLIVKKGEAQRVRDIVEQIKAAGRTELL